MITERNSASNTSPLLFRYATPRTSHPELPGRYDPKQQLWVIDINGERLPVVHSADDELLETRTTTKVVQEADDTDISADGALSCSTLAELATKTDVQQESDDEISTKGPLELETRTANNQEGVDEDWPRMLMELQTKTFSNVEEDDDCWHTQ